MILRVAVAIAVLALAFGVLLPQMADYGEAWDAITTMDAGVIVLLALVACWNLFTYWPVLVLAQPGLRLREAAVVNQASTAVANTVPAGAAVAVGVTFRMLRAWGFTSESITNQTLVTGLWNQFVKFGMPVLGMVAVAISGDVDSSVIRLSVWGVAALAATVAVGAVALRAEHSTARLGALLDRCVGQILRALGRPRDTQIQAWLLRLRIQLRMLLHARALPLSAAALVSHLSLFLVLLVAIRAVGVSSAQLSWTAVLLGFALVRLLSAIPITPGGVGVVELGYLGFLGQSTTGDVDSDLAAAVLLFRAITYMLPVVLGGAAWLVFQRTPHWRHEANSRGLVATGDRLVAT